MSKAQPQGPPGGRPSASPATGSSKPVEPAAAARDQQRGAGQSAERPPPGLDAERHAATQRRAQKLDTLKKGAFPALMAAALNISAQFDSTTYWDFLDLLIKEAGNPTDPIEVMMLQQLAMAHFRVAQLHVDAAQSKAVEATKIYAAAASRLLGEFRRTALGLQAYRAQSPRQKPAQQVKLYKAAQ